MRKEIMFAGSGGQGVITASIILAEAVALHEGRYVAQSQSYGPEARGGTSNANVIISEVPVGYPKTTQPHFMVCLTQESFDRFSTTLRPGGLMLTDRSSVRRLKQIDARLYNLPIFDAVKEKIGLPIVFNICVLGALAELTGLVRLQSLREVVKTRVPPRFLTANLGALDLGAELAVGARLWRYGYNSEDSDSASHEADVRGK